MFRRKQYWLLHGGELLAEGNLKEIANATQNRLENIYGKGIDNVYPGGLQK